MPDWLATAASADPGLPAADLVARTLLSVLLGFVVAGVYRATTGRANAGDGLPTTLVLLCVLVAVVVTYLRCTAGNANHSANDHT